MVSWMSFSSFSPLSVLIHPSPYISIIPLELRRFLILDHWIQSRSRFWTIIHSGVGLLRRISISLRVLRLQTGLPLLSPLICFLLLPLNYLKPHSAMILETPRYGCSNFRSSVRTWLSVILSMMASDFPRG